MIVEYKQRNFQINRYPKTTNRSLQPLNAGDEYLLETLAELDIKPGSLVIYNDRFGALTCLLNELTPYTVMDYRSQEKACLQNLEANKIVVDKKRWLNSLDPLPESISIGVIKIPKSLDLFRFYLYRLAHVLTEDGSVFCSFMTRHFTPQMVSIADEFFEEVQQSRAWKKSRLLILQKKKSITKNNFIRTVKWDDDHDLKQYPGVFSANSVDSASRFLMEHMHKIPGAQRMLDLASGNGLLAVFLRQEYPDAEIHLLDDFRLAIESSRLNLSGDHNVFHWDDNLDIFEPDFFDFVISNPPFHFEYETNIEVALTLFRGVKKCLRPGGRFQLVASRHLNYKTHLKKLFTETIIVAENEKFVVYDCSK